METKPNHLESVRGLLDAQRVAAYLGVPQATIRSWAKRKSDGVPGVHQKFPAPLEQRLGGTALWDEQEILTFKEVFDKEPRMGKRERKDASDTLRSVESEHG